MLPRIDFALLTLGLGSRHSFIGLTVWSTKRLLCSPAVVCIDHGVDALAKLSIQIFDRGAFFVDIVTVFMLKYAMHRSTLSKPYESMVTRTSARMIQRVIRIPSWQMLESCMN